MLTSVPTQAYLSEMLVAQVLLHFLCCIDLFDLTVPSSCDCVIRQQNPQYVSICRFDVELRPRKTTHTHPKKSHMQVRQYAINYWLLALHAYMSHTRLCRNTSLALPYVSVHALM